MPVFCFMQRSVKKNYNKRGKNFDSKAKNQKKMPSRDLIIQKVIAISEPLIEAEEMELIHVEYRRESSGWVLRLYIDKPGGVNLDDCISISRLISDVLDVSLEQQFDETNENKYSIPPYNLEVSSPGIKRPLKKRKDFQRFINEKIYVKLKEPMNNRKNFKGILSNVSDDTIDINIDKKIYNIPLTAINMARLDY